MIITHYCHDNVVRKWKSFKLFSVYCHYWGQLRAQSRNLHCRQLHLFCFMLFIILYDLKYILFYNKVAILTNLTNFIAFVLVKTQFIKSNLSYLYNPYSFVLLVIMCGTSSPLLSYLIALLLSMSPTILPHLLSTHHLLLLGLCRR